MSSPKQNLHLAIVMDGNGRWATARGFERLKGHKKGVERVREIVEACPSMGVKYLTLFAFSTENWKRSEKEVTGLMSLFRRYIKSEAARLHKEGVRVRFIGRRDGLEPRLQELMAGLEEQTASGDVLHLTVAINYGARDEIVRATQKVAAKVASGAIKVEDINDKLVGAEMDTVDLPYPDLILRTSGEFRTSNFLAWQAVYAEYVFEQTPWPDFTKELLAKTLDEFRNRERRFGAVSTK